MARLCPLFSGSTGNSYYIGSRSAGLLIDAGRSAKQLDAALKTCGIDPLAVQGVLITHEHSDHISGLRVFAKKYSLPVFASQGTIEAIGEMDGVKMYEVQRDMQIGDMTVTYFHTSHDCAEPLGFRIRTEENRIVTLSTDLGYLSEEVKESLYGTDYAIIESNHDLEMLRTGDYPYYLKRRILSDEGHLSNRSCAEFLPELLKSGTRRFLLAHLSRENNTPSMAFETSLSSLIQAGYVQNTDFILETAPVENTEGKVRIF